jgi:hypothetical protein
MLALTPEQKEGKKRAKQKYADSHKSERRESNRRWRLRNPERHKNAVKRWRQNRKEDYWASARRSSLKRTYGANIAQHQQRVRQEQRGKCPLCLRSLDTSRRPSQDHSHKCCPPVIGRNGKPQVKTCGRCLRGILCTRCNQALGFIENEAWLERAIAYIKMWDERLFSEKAS